uniref:E1 ubiquitin-activating enzyme n=1 Tax=Eutreptiella gymnastica TaxID=73025 RepID=A0A7S4D0L7_9EUGL
MADAQDGSVLDESLYSRQLYVLGAEAMQRMSRSDVLVVGLSGLGCEIAKNIILSGVKSITVSDSEDVTWADLGTHFFVGAEDIGKNRVECCLAKLAELNPYVVCKQHAGRVDLQFVTTFHTVVMVDQGSVEGLMEMNAVCRQQGTHFIAVESRGVFGYVFVDFGDQFHVVDVDGTEPARHVITDITTSEAAEVTVDEESGQALGLAVGDVVQIDYVEGMAGINGTQHTVLQVTGKHKIVIGDTRDMGQYVRGGYLSGTKKQETMRFKSLGDSIQSPEFVVSDYAQMDRPGQLHVAWLALHRWRSAHGRWPQSYNAAEAEEVVELARSLDLSVPSDVVRALAYTARGSLNPLCCFLGGIAAQEVLKSCSGKFRPIQQWFYFDAVECLPSVSSAVADPKQFTAEGVRYESQIAVLGQQMQETLKNLNYFVVGAGALGCELLKNMALMGVGAGARGSVTVTDMDAIEVSNLSRQFLFRRQHVGQLKSSTAAAAAKVINHSIKIRHMSHKVHPETEHIFDDRFWDRLDGVVNALDNIPARLYVDSKCISYRKPLLESGTLGAQANCQVIIPMLTESYGTQRDPEEQSIPMCTMHYYPNTIDHTIHWARDLFSGLFSKPGEEANKFVRDPAGFFKSLEKEENVSVCLQAVENVCSLMIVERPGSIEDCVYWARRQFEDRFSNDIKQLLHIHPLDKLGDDGKLFWSGSKKPPKPLQFDTADPGHMEFVLWATVLFASVYQLPVPDLAQVRDAAIPILQKFQPEPFKPRDVFIPASEGDTKKEAPPPGEVEMKESPRSDEQLQQLAQREAEIQGFLAQKGESACALSEIEFEKDDPSNGHIDFITAASNLRARNYGIPEADKMHTKRISGRIIPAMITTTALITGFVCLQLYKLAMKKSMQSFRNVYVNLAVPCVIQSEPQKPPQVYYLPASTEGSAAASSSTTSIASDPLVGQSFTLWDRLDLNVGRDISLTQFLGAFKNKYHMSIVMMSHGAVLIYHPTLALPSAAYDMPLTIMLSRLFGIELGPTRKYVDFTVNCDSLTGQQIPQVPPVRYKFKGAKTAAAPAPAGGSG